MSFSHWSIYANIESLQVEQIGCLSKYLSRVSFNISFPPLMHIPLSYILYPSLICFAFCLFLTCTTISLSASLKLSLTWLSPLLRVKFVFLSVCLYQISFDMNNLFHHLYFTSCIPLSKILSSHHHLRGCSLCHLLLSFICSTILEHMYYSGKPKETSASLALFLLFLSFTYFWMGREPR